MALSDNNNAVRVVTGLLDRFYEACGYLAAVSLIAILVLIVVNMVARWTGQVFPGSTNYAGYAMATASFLALAYALGRGAHIRVSLLLSALGRYRWWGEVWALGIGSIVGCYFAWFAVRGTYWSHKLNDVSQGQDATPLWIPQLAMAVGSCVLALALVDHFLRALFTGRSWIERDPIEDPRDRPEA